jgi:hypothetical protein
VIYGQFEFRCIDFIEISKLGEHCANHRFTDSSVGVAPIIVLESSREIATDLRDVSSEQAVLCCDASAQVEPFP